MITSRYLYSLVLPAALVVTSACAAISGSAMTGTQLGLPCTTSQSQIREQLQRLNAVDAQNRAQLLTYSAALRQMLLACDAEARTMNVTLADDWRIQSFFVRKDLSQFEGTDSSAMVALLPPHRRRVERLIATYTAMYGNPPRGR